jgi:hypothetical protein
MKKIFLFAAAVVTALSMHATVWNVSDWTAAEPYTTLDNNGLVLIPGSKTFKVTANAKSWENPKDASDAFAFTQRLQTGGAGKATERAIQIPVNANEFVEVWAITSNGTTTGKIYFGTASADINGEALNYFCYQNKTAGNLVIYADCSTNYYAFRTGATNVEANVTDGEQGQGGGESAAGVWDFAEWPIASGYTNQVKDNLGLYACSPSAETQITNFGVTEESKKKFDDGYQGVNRFKLGGGGFSSEAGFSATPTQRFVYFDVTAASDIKVWYRGGGSSERSLYITDGTNVLAELSTTNSDPQILSAKSNGAARIYIFGSNGQNLYKIEATNVGTTQEIKDDEQGFEEIFASPKATKMVYQGQVVIVKEGRMFNLLGSEIAL